MIWILTFELNEYYQEGEYFVHAWNHKPSADELKDYIEDYFVGDPQDLNHILNGGGRRGTEDKWYHLRTI